MLGNERGDVFNSLVVKVQSLADLIKHDAERRKGVTFTKDKETYTGRANIREQLPVCLLAILIMISYVFFRVIFQVFLWRHSMLWQRHSMLWQASSAP